VDEAHALDDFVYPHNGFACELALQLSASFTFIGMMSALMVESFSFMLITGTGRRIGLTHSSCHILTEFMPAVVLLTFHVRHEGMTV